MSTIKLFSYGIFLAIFAISSCDRGEGTGLLDLMVIAPPQLPLANRLELEGTKNIKRILLGDFPPPGTTSLRVQYPNFPVGKISLTLTTYDTNNCQVASKKFVVQIEAGKKTQFEVKLDRFAGPCGDAGVIGDAGSDNKPSSDGSATLDLDSSATKDAVFLVLDNRSAFEALSPDGINYHSFDTSSDQTVASVDVSNVPLIDTKAPDVPVCQPKPRDCTSSLDNDCNGTPDNQETTYCTCTQGDTQRCQEHPGKDGKGICVAGKQECELSVNKSTSAWSKTCVGSVGPSAIELCDTEKKDENCDGQSNEGCDCVSGTEVDCGTCGGKALCTNGQPGTCSKLPKPRDCASTLDNDCNGTLDNQETSCANGVTCENSKDCASGNCSNSMCCASGDRRCGSKCISSLTCCTGNTAACTNPVKPSCVDGDCMGGALTITPLSKNYLTIEVGKNSMQTFTVTNTGAGEINGITISVAGTGTVFLIASSSNCSSLLKNSICTVIVQFAPSAPSDYSGTIVITSVSGGTVSASLTGSGKISCGGPNQDCCSVGIECTTAGYSCQTGTCKACGGQGQLCCNGDKPMTYYLDADKDSFGDANNHQTSCTGAPADGKTWVTNGNDFNDNNQPKLTCRDERGCNSGEVCCVGTVYGYPETYCTTGECLYDYGKDYACNPNNPSASGCPGQNPFCLKLKTDSSNILYEGLFTCSGS